MSKLDQVHSRPPTVILTTRADMRYIATLANFWHNHGESPRSISDLVRLSLESFAEFLISANRTSFVQTHTDAAEIIDRLGLKIKKVNPRNLAEALAREDSTFDDILSSPTIDHSHQQRTKSNPVSQDDPILASAKIKLEQAMQNDLNSRVAEAKKRTQEFKDALIPKESI